MKLFIYEYLTGGGLLGEGHSSQELESLAVEGRAMCVALIEDSAKINGVQVICLRDFRQANWRPQGCRCLDIHTAAEHTDRFDQAAAEADWTVVIAPEIGGTLAERCRRVIAVGGRLLGCSPQLVDLTSDKHATAEYLLNSGVPAPRGIPFLLGQPWPVDFPYPAIWKPRGGAGSQGLRFVEHHDAIVPQADGRPGRLEELCPRLYSTPHAPREDRSLLAHHGGTHASVALLCGPQAQVCLPPCTQRLDRAFHYLGGSLPLPPRLVRRASLLARRAVESLPEPLGYLGIDLVLGEREDGRDDVVIEINPRLTTSYVGLRAACHENLAAAMLAIASGGSYCLSFREERIEFSADGQVCRP